MDDDGQVDVPDTMVIGASQGIFGDKIYGDIHNDLDQPMKDIINTTTPDTPHDQITKTIDDFKGKVRDTITAAIVPPLSDQYGMNKAQQKKVERDISSTIDDKFDNIADDYKKSTNIAQIEHKHSLENAETPEQVKAADDKFNSDMKSALDTMTQGLQAATQEIVDNKPQELVKQLETHKAEQEKKGYEDKIRDHLRGFSRTIPSFLMAYGSRDFTLESLDKDIEPKVFEEVTGITLEDFRLLRDGGDILDDKTGKTIFFKGHLFDEQVFNDSVQEFLNKKEALADYFDEAQTEDIFDYIPPQKTNQIFTPRWVVEKMVDDLEKENPGCFDNPDATFADLYMKSGLYITEIVKRLYRSPKMKQLFPYDKTRIHHILEKQVYGMAPSRIIYLIATNYIMGFDETFKAHNPHFVQEDVAEAAKNGTLQEKVNLHFGK